MIKPLILALVTVVTLFTTLTNAKAVTYAEIAEKTCNKQPKGIKRDACYKVELNQLEYHYDSIYDALESDSKAGDAFTRAIHQKDYVNIVKYYKQGFKGYELSGDTYDLPKID